MTLVQEDVHQWPSLRLFKYALSACLHRVQLSSAEDTSNFDMSNTEASWSGDERRQRYNSTGIFKNF